MLVAPVEATLYGRTVTSVSNVSVNESQLYGDLWSLLANILVGVERNISVKKYSLSLLSQVISSVVLEILKYPKFWCRW